MDRHNSERAYAANLPSPIAASFVWAMLAWTLGFLALIRLPWIEQGPVQSLANFQRMLAEWYGATASPLVEVNTSCSGADQIALCLSVTLAYPVAWSRRLIGAVGGLAIVLFLNTIRIGTLLSLAGSPRLFNALHVYVWPCVLMAAIALYLVAWLRWSEGRRWGTSSALVRFGALSCLLLLAHASLAPWLLSSGAVLQAGVWTADAGSALLAATGTVAAQRNVLFTSRGAFQVTQECLLTPLIPVYLAAALTLPRRASGRVLALMVAVPLFAALGVIRLLLVAAPPSVLNTPLIVVHGFFQLALAVTIVAVAALYSSTRGRYTGVLFAAAAVGTGLVCAAFAAPWWNTAVIGGAGLLRPIADHVRTVLRSPDDVQGALLLLPVFQIAFLSALWVTAVRATRLARFCGAVATLFLSQVLLLAAVGEFERHAGVHVHALFIRAWAVALPPLLVFLWTRRSGSLGQESERAAYHDFWQDVGQDFPSLTGAPSTRLYFDNEVRLLSTQIPNLRGCKLFKTDLWDEVKNTHILQWAAEQGARVYGIDLSGPIAHQARAAFNGTRIDVSQADVRKVPFVDGSFDAVYSMGTIEHFPESADAVRELARVLKPGGRLILGVPNLHDPFLRPLFVWLLQRVDMYGYGAERAFSRRELRVMLENAGLRVEAETGILFIPGWLRMLDLWCYTRCRPLVGLCRPLVAAFRWLDRQFPDLCRHGYLIASVGVKPGASVDATDGARKAMSSHA